MPPFLSRFVGSKSENSFSLLSFSFFLLNVFIPLPPPLQLYMSWSSPPVANIGRFAFVSIEASFLFLGFANFGPVSPAMRSKYNLDFSLSAVLARFGALKILASSTIHHNITISTYVSSAPMRHIRQVQPPGSSCCSSIRLLFSLLIPLSFFSCFALSVSSKRTSWFRTFSR